MADESFPISGLILSDACFLSAFSSNSFVEREKNIASFSIFSFKEIVLRVHKHPASSQVTPCTYIVHLHHLLRYKYIDRSRRFYSKRYSQFEPSFLSYRNSLLFTIRKEFYWINIRFPVYHCHSIFFFFSLIAF